MSLGSTLSFDPHRHQCVLEIHHLKMLDVCGFCEKKKKKKKKRAPVSRSIFLFAEI